MKKQRVLTAILLTITLLPIILINYFFEIAMFFFVVKALHEMRTVFLIKNKKNKKTNFIYYLLFPAIFLLGNFFIRIPRNLIILLILVSFTICFFHLFTNNRDLRNSELYFFIITGFYLVLGASSLIYLKNKGILVIIFSLLLTSTNDIFAYLIGKKIGKKPFFSFISPNKTLEGAFAGLLISTVLSYIFASTTGVFNTIYFVDSSPILLILICLFGNLFSQMGDLIASKTKRMYEVKDFGKFFPGHGGTLDRFDAILMLSQFIVLVFLIFS